MSTLFNAKMAALLKMVGTGELTGQVTVDQPYALVQHERTDFAHPRGGEAKYLETPLKDKHPGYLSAIANDVLDKGPQDAMTDAVENLADEVSRKDPVETGALRDSASPSVTSAGNLVYHRAPNADREGR